MIEGWSVALDDNCGSSTYVQSLSTCQEIWRKDHKLERKYMKREWDSMLRQTLKSIQCYFADDSRNLERFSTANKILCPWYTDNSLIVPVHGVWLVFENILSRWMWADKPKLFIGSEPLVHCWDCFSTENQREGRTLEPKDM